MLQFLPQLLASRAVSCESRALATGLLQSGIASSPSLTLGVRKITETFTVSQFDVCVKMAGVNHESNAETSDEKPLVGIIMGSTSDWDTMRHAHETLLQFGVAHECRVVSAHRTPQLLVEYSMSAENRGLEVIIAGAGGAAHLPGMCAAQTLVPVLGVPVESRILKGQDSLLSIVQMPAGVPVGTLAIGNAGATNAALLAVAMLSNSRPALREKLRQFRAEQTQRVLDAMLPDAMLPMENNS